MIPLNFSFIPFLLGVHIPSENVTEWKFGPEYVFQMNKTTIVHGNNGLDSQDITAMVNCRPIVLNNSYLLCNAYDIFVSKNTSRTYKANGTWKNQIVDVKVSVPDTSLEEVPDTIFQMEFRRPGMHDYLTEASTELAYDIILDTIEQFDIGTDLSAKAGDRMKDYENMKSGSHIIGAFTENEENTRRASGCHTSCILTYTPSNEYNKNEETEIKKNKAEFDFHLELLPISYTNPMNKTFLIEKNRITCTDQAQYLWYFDKHLRISNVEQYFNKMEIRDKEPKFTSYTHLKGHVSFPENLDTYYHFTEDVYLQLLRIQPAHTKRLYWGYYTFD